MNETFLLKNEKEQNEKIKKNQQNKGHEGKKIWKSSAKREKPHQGSLQGFIYHIVSSGYSTGILFTSETCFCSQQHRDLHHSHTCYRNTRVGMHWSIFELLVILVTVNYSHQWEDLTSKNVHFQTKTLTYKKLIWAYILEKKPPERVLFLFIFPLLVSETKLLLHERSCILDKKKISVWS